MIGCLRTSVRKQPIIALYFEFETVLRFYNLKAWFCDSFVFFLVMQPCRRERERENEREKDVYFTVLAFVTESRKKSTVCLCVRVYVCELY